MSLKQIDSIIAKLSKAGDIEKILKLSAILEKFQQGIVRKSCKRKVWGKWQEFDSASIPEPDYNVLAIQAMLEMNGYDESFFSKLKDDARYGVPNPVATDLEIMKEFHLTKDELDKMPESQRAMMVSYMDGTNEGVRDSIERASKDAGGGETF